MREIKVFNNLKRKKEVLVTGEPGKVKFYSCGPTTYDFLHVGNARALVVGDLFHRVLKSFGYEVLFVRNYTDVDDKIIEKAKNLNRDPLAHAHQFVLECEKDMDSLGMLPATVTPKVSENIPEIIQMIQDIISHGRAYESNGEVLFSVKDFPDYGKLSKKKIESLQHGARVEVDEKKKNPADFVLWKPAKEGEPSWNSPWGQGRPGWHIECSAMAKKFLGTTLDLHHGGIDLMFPHHENEIAQSESANECLFCRQWVHNEFLNFGHEKMSKSLGNVIKIRDFVETYSGQVLRHLLLSVHYRARLEWSEESLKKAVDEVKKIHQFVLDFEKNSETGIFEASEILDCCEKMKNELSNDFNSAGAMGHFFSLIKISKSHMSELSLHSKEAVKESIIFVQKALGLIHDQPQDLLNHLSKLEEKTIDVDEAWINTLIQQRKEAKMQKNWSQADSIRDELLRKNIVLKDHPDGKTSWSVKSH